MKIRRLLVAALVTLSWSSLAFANNEGTVTGTFKLFPGTCKQPSNPTLNGVVAIPGTSFAAHFTANGKFTMYNVKPGQYNLALWSLNGSSFSPMGTSVAGPNTTIGAKFTVRNGRTTSLGTIAAADNCCGNGLIDGTEVCDGSSLKGKTCLSLGLPDGELRCENSCDALDTTGCGTQP